MKKKSIARVICFIIFVFVLFSGCTRINTQNSTKDGLEILNWSAGLGGASGNDLDQSKYSYLFQLKNESSKTVFINSIQPLISDTIKSKVLSTNTVIDVNKEIKPDETIEVKGEIVFDTKGSSKSDILKLEPFLTDVKISTVQTIKLEQ
jgi:hypothetical protein